MKQNVFLIYLLIISSSSTNVWVLLFAGTTWLTTSITFIKFFFWQALFLLDYISVTFLHFLFPFWTRMSSLINEKIHSKQSFKNKCVCINLEFGVHSKSSKCFIYIRAYCLCVQLRKRHSFASNLNFCCLWAETR